MILSTEYSGYTINYDTYNGTYQAIKNGGVVKESKKLEMIEAFIESGGKEKKKFKRVNVLIRGGWSVRDLYIKGHLLLDIPANHALIDQIKAKQTEKKKIDDDIEAIEKGFQYLTPEMMEENKED